jgi:predicted secreted Zn-dependent protease
MSQPRARPPRLLAAPCGVLLVGGVLLAGTGRADLAEQRDYSWYPVSLQKGASLRELLNAASPVHTDGRTYHAHTEWHVNWHYHYLLQPGGGCRIDSVHTTLTATITLPAPADPALADSPAFVTYLGALKRHEEGHYAIGRSAAAAIDQGILALPSQDSCTGLAATVDAFANEELARARDTEARYDRDTGHGRTQGAVLN